jgi:hypothetical protein
MRPSRVCWPPNSRPPEPTERLVGAVSTFTVDDVTYIETATGLRARSVLMTCDACGTQSRPSARRAAYRYACPVCQ